jgi:hypothetical protein
MSYASAADVKAYSAVAEVLAKSDADLAKFVSRAERLINAFTRQNFNKSASKKILVDGTGSQRLPLPERIVTLSQMRFLEVSDGGAIIDASLVVTDVFINKGWVLIAGDEDVYLRRRIGKNYSDDGGIIFPLGKQNIELTGEFGYATVPDEVKDATCAIVERMIVNEASAKAKQSVFKSESIGDYSYTMADDANSIAALIPAEAKLLLKSFIKPILLARI